MSQLSGCYSSKKGEQDAIGRPLELLMGRQLSALDLLPHADLREKLVELVLYGQPAGLDAETVVQFQHLRIALEDKAIEDVQIVVFGGGTGLSNLIGGDSR
ncbi:MAG: YvcK family protein, partial [Desulfocapsaceae bacterium]|nr:YvcK family protein [Desulfocapsaceae bacterium]